MSTAPRIHYGAGIWQIPQTQARRESQPAPAGPALAGGSFASPAWKAPAMHAAQDGSLHSLQGATMGTTWSLRLANPDYAPLAPVQALVQHTLDAVIAQMSNWEADSCVSRFNAADAGSWHVLPPELAQVLDAALHWARVCDGAYDPTVGALVSLWGFGPRANPQAPHSGQAPVQADIDRALQVCGHQRLQWQPQQWLPQQWLPQQRRLLQPGGLQLDLSGIAKGYAVDWGAERLRAAGWQHALLEVGGEIRAWGQKPGGQPWRVAVAGVAGDEPLVVPLGDGALASSGDHWHVFMQGGQRFSHSLDPRTGRPVAHALTSVTVYHRDCMHADALATVLTVLGPEDGWQFALQQQLAAVFHSHPDAWQPQGLRRMTPAWEQRFAGSMKR